MGWIRLQDEKYQTFEHNKGLTCWAETLEIQEGSRQEVLFSAS